VKILIDKAYAHCEQLLRDNADKLHALVEYLLDKESINGDQFEDLMEGREIGEASATSLLDTTTELQE